MDRGEQMQRGTGFAGAAAILGIGAAGAGYASKSLIGSAASGVKNSVKSWASQGRAGYSAEMAIAKQSLSNEKRIASVERALNKDTSVQGRMAFAAKGALARGKALYNNFGSTKAFMAGGAALGAVIGGAASDDTAKGAARGAAIGAGAGLVTKAAIGAISTYNKAGGFGKAGLMGGAVLASTAIFAGVRSLTRQPASMQYGETDASGETQYSNSPVKSRMESMNASGDIVLGLNNKRRR